MKRRAWRNNIVWLLPLCLFISGCAGQPDQKKPDVMILSEETVRSQIEAAGASENVNEVETVVLEEPVSFLEEGSRFARSELSGAELFWYDDMEQILGGYQSEVELSKEGLDAGLTEENIDRIFQCVLNDHPELFYVEGYSYVKYTRYGGDSGIVSIEFSGRYNVDRETAIQRREQIDRAVDRILAGIDADAHEYDKVKYVYDTLIRETEYQLDSPDNQNIYSVFVNHFSVCQGYAKATQYLLNRLGVKCALVLGTVNTGEGHAWNLVRIDGSYYYVDTTWGDASYQLEEDGSPVPVVQPEINYDYLNVTTEELVRTHTINDEFTMPDCTDRAANYYVREGALFDSYNKEQLSWLLVRAMAEGRTDVTIKCTTLECYQEMIEALIHRQEIFNYLSWMGDTIAYTQNDTQLSMTFWMTNEE